LQALLRPVLSWMLRPSSCDDVASDAPLRKRQFEPVRTRICILGRAPAAAGTARPRPPLRSTPIRQYPITACQRPHALMCIRENCIIRAVRLDIKMKFLISRARLSRVFEHVWPGLELANVDTHAPHTYQQRPHSGEGQHLSATATSTPRLRKSHTPEAEMTLKAAHADKSSWGQHRAHAHDRPRVRVAHRALSTGCAEDTPID